MREEIARLGERQFSLVSEEQLAQLGMTETQVRWQVKRGDQIRVRPRVLRFAGSPVSWEQAVLAAALNAGAGAVVSHTTAAAVWNRDTATGTRPGSTSSSRAGCVSRESSVTGPV